jgi:hypothetical protein
MMFLAGFLFLAVLVFAGVDYSKRRTRQSGAKSGGALIPARGRHVAGDDASAAVPRAFLARFFASVLFFDLQRKAPEERERRRRKKILFLFFKLKTKWGSFLAI